MKDIIEILKLEIKAITKRWPFVVMVLVVGILYAFIFPAIYWQRGLSNIPIMIIDKDNSSLSRQMTQAVSSSPVFFIKETGEKPEDFYAGAQKGEIKLALFFPNNFEKDIKTGIGAKVLVLADMSNLMIGNIGLNTAVNLLGSYGVGIEAKKIMKQKGISFSSALNQAAPIQEEIRHLFNPAFNDNYATFLIPALMFFGLQALTLFITTFSMTEENLSPFVKYRGKLFKLIFCKAVPYFVLMSMLMLFMVGFSFSVLGIKVVGSFCFFLLLSFWFILFLVLLGISISGIIGDPIISTEVMAFLAMPSFLVSGFTWPGFAMPVLLEKLTWILPFTSYIEAIRRVVVKGASFFDVLNLFPSLILWNIFVFLLVYIAFPFAFRRIDRKNV